MTAYLSSLESALLVLEPAWVCKPLDLQKLQYHFRDCQTKSGDGDFIRVNGEVITGVGGELMFSSQIKEKPPDGLSLHQSPNKPTRGQTFLSAILFERRGYRQTVLSAILFERRGYSNDQSIKNGSLAKLEMQQSNLGSCLAASFDIGAVRGSYLRNQKKLSNKLNCHGNLTHHGLTSNWNHVQRFSNERVMGSTSRVILCLLCLNFSEFRTSQSCLWRPDMMHLFLSKESCADYMKASKHTKGKNKREEDKRFKPPDLSQERHQDVICFILIKEALPDTAYKPKPSRNKFGIRLLLYDNFSFANLHCFNVSGLNNESGTKWINAFYISEPVSNNAYQRGLQGKIDLRTNPFQEGGDDIIMDQSNKEDNESVDDPADGGALAISEGPMTRARSKQLKESIGGLLKTSLKQEESLRRSLIN
uniref:Uncharacterized protein n=1 Tax=Brassica oleracea var. oleracea TaxID=109376 RepID=A0A0D3DSW8_BRAOL